MLPYHLKPCYTVKLFTAMPLAWRGHLGLPQDRAPVTPSNLGHSRSCTNSARQVKAGAANRWLVFAGYGSVSYLKDRQHSDPFVDPTTGSEIGLLVFRVCFQEQRRNPARSHHRQLIISGAYCTGKTTVTRAASGANERGELVVLRGRPL
jgi:hypothetical protein